MMVVVLMVVVFKKNFGFFMNINEGDVEKDEDVEGKRRRNKKKR